MLDTYHDRIPPLLDKYVQLWKVVRPSGYGYAFFADNPFCFINIIDAMCESPCKFISDPDKIRIKSMFLSIKEKLWPGRTISLTNDCVYAIRPRYSYFLQATSLRHWTRWNILSKHREFLLGRKCSIYDCHHREKRILQLSSSSYVMGIFFRYGLIFLYVNK